MITDYAQTRHGTITSVTVTSDLSGTIYYHWYRDGVHVAATESATYWFVLQDQESLRIEVFDTNDADFDPIANAPDGWPARRTIWWVRSTATDVHHYRVDQKLGAGAWSQIAVVYPETDIWSYSVVTPRLTDLSSYTWRIVPVDAAGNDGTALEIGTEKIVRTPDAPEFTVSFDSGTTKVTFAAA